MKGVVEERSARDDLVVVWGHVRKPLADRPESDRLRRLGGLFGEVRAVDDPRQVSQGRVAGETLVDQLLEGAAALLVPVWIAGSGRVKADRPFTLLDGRDVVWLHENDLGIRVEETRTGDWMILLPQGTRWRMAGRDRLILKREEGEYSPEFGKSTVRPVLVWRIEGQLPIDAVVEILEEG